MITLEMVMNKKLTKQEVDKLMQKPAYERTEEEHKMLDEFFEEYFKDVPPTPWPWELYKAYPNSLEWEKCVHYSGFGDVFFMKFEFIP